MREGGPGQTACASSKGGCAESDYVKLLPAGATYSNATSPEAHFFAVVKNSLCRR